MPEGGARATISDQPLSWFPTEFLPYVDLQWPRIPGAAQYRIELSTGGSAGETLAVIVDEGSAEYFVWRSFAVADEAIYGIIVTPEDATGQAGEPRVVTIDTVIHPTPELVTFTYDDDPEQTLLTIAAA